MRRIVTICGLAAVLPAAAVAAERVGSPARVAEAGGAVLLAQPAAGGGLCLDVRTRSRRVADDACARPPRSVLADLEPRLLRDRGTTLLYGAVSPRTRQVDLLLSHGGPLRVRTRRGEHDGPERFYLAAVDEAAAVGGVTARAGDGRVRAARDLNPMALPPLGARPVLARVRDERRRRVAVVAAAVRVLAPTAARPGRRRAALCVGLRRRGAPAAARALCVRDPDRMQVTFSTDCATGRSVLHGLVPERVRSASVVLAGGSRRPAALRPVPAGTGRGGSAALVAVLDGTPRRVIGRDARGRPVVASRLTGGC